MRGQMVRAASTADGTLNRDSPQAAARVPGRGAFVSFTSPVVPPARKRRTLRRAVTVEITSRDRVRSSGRPPPVLRRQRPICRTWRARSGRVRPPRYAPRHARR
ncbi:DUF448 domain-containing protein [Xanthobacter autotrophicus]|uniref:DUF448 domain-containing protein n=1 Tax=Xanthobacter autotrophicus TaxID=280 RepID=A0A6C1KDK3_XANAU|nr:DUF448 domain-containing protein [Xanthobacter autotrophicus]